jgi:prophage regulatory protein
MRIMKAPNARSNSPDTEAIIKASAPRSLSIAGPDYQLLSKKEVAALTSLSATTIWRLVRRKLFPPPIKLSPGRIGWRLGSVIDWLNDPGRNASSVVSRHDP